MIIFDKERIGVFVANCIGNTREWSDYQAIGIEKDGVLIAGVVIDDYIKNSRCSIHCAGIGKRWLNRDFLFVVFDYVFRQLNCNCVVNLVDSENLDSIKFTEHLGFELVYKIKDGINGKSNTFIFEMQKSNCKWLKLRG